MTKEKADDFRFVGVPEEFERIEDEDESVEKKK